MNSNTFQQTRRSSFRSGLFLRALRTGLALAVLAMVGASLPAQAAPPQQAPARVAQGGGIGETAPVVTNLSLDQLESLVRGMNLSPTREKGAALRFKLGGFNVFLFTKGVDIQLYAWFSDKVGVAKLNDWNRTQRFCRAYVDKDGDSVLESDLDLEGGVTLENVKAFIDSYRSLLPVFARHLAK